MLKEEKGRNGEEPEMIDNDVFSSPEGMNEEQKRMVLTCRKIT